MEDYDIFNEMKNIKKTIVVIEDDEKFIKNLLDLNIEIIPVRFDYDLSIFSDEYITKTKNLFTYYYDNKNSYHNEKLRLKKHFIHYQRKPFIAYIPNNEEYSQFKQILKELGIIVVSNKAFLNKFLIEKKLIFIDSDGTLKNSDGIISEKNKKMIKKNIEIGNKIFICTSRPRYQTLEVMNDSGASDIIISSNGSEIYDANNKKIIFNSYIENKEVLKLVEYAFSNDLRLILTLEDFEYVTKEIRTSKQKLLNKLDYKTKLNNCQIKQCMFIDKKQDLILEIKKIVSLNEKLRIVDEINENSLYEEKWFSLANKDCSKGNALKILANYLNISIDNTIAIGNDKNDLSMFKEAGLSVAVENAALDIKNNVDYITLSNDDDGVASFLEKLL